MQYEQEHIKQGEVKEPYRTLWHRPNSAYEKQPTGVAEKRRRRTIHEANEAHPTVDGRHHDARPYWGRGMALAATIISCPGGSAECFGTNNDDRIKGSDSSEKIYAQGGNDTVAGNGEWDVLFGDDPNATDSSLDGNDKLDGGTGDDGLHGYGGSDTLIGGSGDDIINSELRETPQAQNRMMPSNGLWRFDRRLIHQTAWKAHPRKVITAIMYIPRLMGI